MSHKPDEDVAPVFHQANQASHLPDQPVLHSQKSEREIVDMRPRVKGLDLPSTKLRADRNRLRAAAWAFSTRRVPVGAASRVLTVQTQPRVGDLVLARVDAIGQHANLQLANGRPRHMFAGDEIVVAYGNRYASSQFEAVMPNTLGPCHLVAGGGLASRAISKHVKMTRGPTQITPIGLVGNTQGERLNLIDFSLPVTQEPSEFNPATIAVLGTSMDSGKTQTCVHLIRGLVGAGLRVGYAKITGTGAGGDIWWVRDAGAEPVLDFTDMGMPSTYKITEQHAEELLASLIQHVANEGVDVVVVEIADGVLQKETAALIESTTFANMVDGVILAAQDSMGASAGHAWLQRAIPPVIGLSGVLTAAPLQVQEAFSATGLGALNREELGTPRIALNLLALATQNPKGFVQERTGGR